MRAASTSWTVPGTAVAAASSCPSRKRPGQLLGEEGVALGPLDHHLDDRSGSSSPPSAPPTTSALSLGVRGCSEICLA